MNATVPRYIVEPARERGGSEIVVGLYAERPRLLHSSEYASNLQKSEVYLVEIVSGRLKAPNFVEHHLRAFSAALSDRKSFGRGCLALRKIHMETQETCICTNIINTQS